MSDLCGSGFRTGVQGSLAQVTHRHWRRPHHADPLPRHFGGWGGISGPTDGPALSSRPDHLSIGEHGEPDSDLMQGSSARGSTPRPYLVPPATLRLDSAHGTPAITQSLLYGDVTPLQFVATISGIASGPSPEITLLSGDLGPDIANSAAIRLPHRPRPPGEAKPASHHPPETRPPPVSNPPKRPRNLVPISGANCARNCARAREAGRGLAKRAR